MWVGKELKLKITTRRVDSNWDTWWASRIPKVGRNRQVRVEAGVLSQRPELGE
jgi:hypothetical protein